MDAKQKAAAIQNILGDNNIEEVLHLLMDSIQAARLQRHQQQQVPITLLTDQSGGAMVQQLQLPSQEPPLQQQEQHQQMDTSDRKRKETEEEAEERTEVEKEKEEAAIKAADTEHVAPPTPPPCVEINPLGHDQSSMDADEDDALPLGGKGSPSLSSSTTGSRPGPYSGKKSRIQSEAPDTLQLTLDIAAALAKGKDASNTLPAPAFTGNINVVEPAGAADAGAGAADDPAGRVAPSTPPSSG